MKPAPFGAWNRWNVIIALLALAIVVALVVGSRGELSGAVEPGAAGPAGVKASKAAPDQAVLRDALDAALAEQRKRRAPPAGEEDPAIAEHLEMLDKELEPDEAAARLSALGNLCQQKKGDFNAAAGYYEFLIERYPEWEGIAGVYRELITCYTKTGDQQELRVLYRKMIDHFPEDSDEHRAAQEALKP